MANSYWDSLPEALQVVINQRKCELEVCDILTALRNLAVDVFEQMIVIRVVEECTNLRPRNRSIEVIKGFSDIGIGSALIKKKVSTLCSLLQVKHVRFAEWHLHPGHYHTPKLLSKYGTMRDPSEELTTLIVIYCEIPFTIYLQFRFPDSKYCTSLHEVTQEATINEQIGVTYRSWIYKKSLVLEIRTALNFAPKPLPFNHEPNWTKHTSFLHRNRI